MSRSVVIKARAVEQMTKAALWYDSQSQGLGKRFIESWTLTIRDIQNHPHHYQKRYRNFRIALVSGFPYVVAFEEDTDEIVIYTTIHAHQGPTKRYRK